ncbi:hypothetical protein HY408_00300 [Candidatus Gottesmanbacteria bacterium]|nr:hypothetical protein [Candidatus Gottesmanbacteria bacterium]
MSTRNERTYKIAFLFVVVIIVSGIVSATMQAPFTNTDLRSRAQVQRGSASPSLQVCLLQNTRGRDVETQVCKLFETTCLPDGWVRDQSCDDIDFSQSEVSGELVPDLSISSTVSVSGERLVGRPIILSFTITNIGAAVAEPVLYKLFERSGGVYTVSTASMDTCGRTKRLTPGASCLVAMSFMFSTIGTKDFEAKVDHLNTVGESNENNNLTRVKFTISSPL